MSNTVREKIAHVTMIVNRKRKKVLACAKVHIDGYNDCNRQKRTQKTLVYSRFFSRYLWPQLTCYKMRSNIYDSIAI